MTAQNYVCAHCVLTVCSLCAHCVCMCVCVCVLATQCVCTVGEVLRLAVDNLIKTIVRTCLGKLPSFNAGLRRLQQRHVTCG
jgi:hypothetical protein